MKTLLISPDIFHSEGGISRLMRLYLRALCMVVPNSGQVGFVALADGQEPMPPIDDYTTGRSVLVGLGRGSKMRFIWQCLREGWCADNVICGHIHHSPILAFLSLVRPRLRYFLVAHGIEVWRPYSFLERWGLRRAEKIICVSEYTRRQILRFYPALRPSRAVVLPNTYDPRFFDEPACLKKGTEADRSRILVVSRLVSSDPYKGVDTMIEAMPRILREYPGAELRIVGGGDDVSRLTALVSALKLDTAVHFTGIVDDATLRAEYLAADIFALPSRKEGFGLVYLEAMTYGLPCLAARAGGAPEVVTSEVGVLVEYGNVHQIAYGIADLMRHRRDPVRLRQWTRKFSFPMFQSRLEQILQPTDQTSPA